MTVMFEWDVEEYSPVTSDDYEAGDIIDHNHFGSYADAAAYASSTPTNGGAYRIVLVRDTLDKYDSLRNREWAYMVDGALPEYFEDAYGREGSKVPKRFLRRC